MLRLSLRPEQLLLTKVCLVDTVLVVSGSMQVYLCILLWITNLRMGMKFKTRVVVKRKSYARIAETGESQYQGGSQSWRRAQTGSGRR